MIRAFALVLTVVTGFSGLVYEVAWQKYLATLLGSHGEATSAVLAIFLGGLSVGYALFGRVSRSMVARAHAAGRAARLLVAYGAVEAGIGLYAFSFPYLFAAAQAVSAWLPVDSPFAFGFDVGLATLLIGPPSVLMGGTIPLLTQGLSRSLDDATSLHARVYAFNTAGAFFGALAAGFWLVPALGLVGVLNAVGWLNVFAGASFLALGWRPSPAVPAPSPAAAPAGADAGREAGIGAYASAALLIGFAMMAVQVVFIRLGGLSLGSSHFTFAMVVAVFVLCIALGSMAVAAMSRIARGVIVGNLWLLVVLLIGLYPLLGDAPYWAHALRALFRDQDAGFLPFYANVFVALLVVIGPPVMLSGAALPLLFHHLRDQVDDLGAVAGRLYSWNTVGSLLGALIGGYLLFYWLDLHAVYRVAVAAVVAAAAVVSLRVLPGSRRLWGIAAAVPAALALVALPAWSPKHLSSGTFRARQPDPSTYTGADRFFRAYDPIEVPFYDDDPAVSVAVVDHPVGGKTSRAIVTNGKPDGSIILDYTTMALAGLLPALLAERIERAFVIGWGTGVTVGELAALQSVREVVVAEISSGVLEAAPMFDAFNQGAWANPKVRAVRGDAYRSLLRSTGTYDVIASEPSNPWVTGTEMLYSVEFLEAARRRLNPGGIYVQWFHAYETDSKTIELVLNTFRSVFPHISVWYATGPDFLLIGYTDHRAGDLDRIVARASQPDMAAGLARTKIGSLPELLAHELIPSGVIETLELDETVHTLLHPLLSDRAARAFFRGGQGRMPRGVDVAGMTAGAKGSLVRRLAERQGGELSERARERFAEETCDYRPEECAVVLAKWMYDEPDSEKRFALERKARRQPGFGGSLSRTSLVTLARLFDPEVPANVKITPAGARSAVENFTLFYHHGVPFERDRLRALWSACEQHEEQREACREGRAEAEKRLGDLSPLEASPPAVGSPGSNGSGDTRSGQSDEAAGGDAAGASVE